MKKIKINAKKNIKLYRDVWLTIFAALCLITILSTYNTIAAYQQPTTIEEPEVSIAYVHSGTYDHEVYLKNNSLYGNNTVFGQEVGTYFKKIIDHIDASYEYRFRIYQTATIQGTYVLTAQVQTNIWSKNFTIIPETEFSSNTNQARFTIDFPINTTKYEEYISQVTDEIGVSAQNPMLIIKCSVDLSADTTNGAISESFSAPLQVSLKEDIVNIVGNLVTSESVTTETMIEVEQPEVIIQRTNWAIETIILVAAIVIFAGVTTTKVEPQTTTDKMLKKIKKKYGEWIVETDKLTPPKDAKIISVNSLDDLVKLSEELGKPVIHSTPTLDGEHTFYVFDEAMIYQHVLPEGEQLKKTTRCPKCNTEATCEGTPGQKIHITCSNCGNKGIVTFEKTRKLFPFFKK